MDTARDKTPGSTPPRKADNPVEEDRKEEMLHESYYETLSSGSRGAGDEIARMERRLDELVKKMDGLEERIRSLEGKGPRG